MIMPLTLKVHALLWAAGERSRLWTHGQNKGQTGRGAVLHSPVVRSRCHHTRMYPRRSLCSICGGLQRECSRPLAHGQNTRASRARSFAALARCSFRVSPRTNVHPRSVSCNGVQLPLLAQATLTDALSAVPFECYATRWSTHAGSSSQQAGGGRVW